MKKLIAIIALFGLVFLAACTKEITEEANEMGGTKMEEMADNNEEANEMSDDEEKAETPEMEASEMAEMTNETIETPMTEEVNSTDNVVIDDETVMATEEVTK